VENKGIENRVKISPMKPWGLFLLCVLFFVPLMSSAATNGVHIDNVTISEEHHALQIVFSLTNLSNTPQELMYGIRIQDPAGEDIYEAPVDALLLNGRDSQVEFATAALPSRMKGTYDVFLLSRDGSGLVSVLKYAGQVEVSGMPPTQQIIPSLQDCILVEEGISCTLVNDSSTSVDVNYTIHEGSIYAPVVTEGTAYAIDSSSGTVVVPFSGALVGGDYTYRVWLNDKTLAQNIVVRVEQEEEADTLTTAQVGLNTYLSQEMLIRVFVLGTPVLLLLLLLFVALRRPKGVMVFIAGGIFLSGGIVWAGVTLTDTEPLSHVFNGASQDSGNEQYAVTLDETEFQISDDIGFSIVFQDTALPNAKPSGGSIDVAVDDASWSSLIAVSDTSSIYHKTLPAIGSAGDYTINFRVPELCGGIFGVSLFDLGVFGSTECLFSVPVTIIDNTAPTTPIIAGNCILGEPCDIGIVSTDTDGGQLCYEAESPLGVQESAGCATEGTPVTTQYTFNSCSAENTLVQAQATDSYDLQSAWGEGSTAITGSISCTEPCTHCTYDGIVGDIGIAALPPFIPPSGVVDISWNLTNVATCSVEGVNIESGASVDSWDWDTVRTYESRTSSILTSATRYTLSCTDLDGEDSLSSIIVSPIPVWQEF
jgi:hypothetical protein